MENAPDSRPGKKPTPKTTAKPAAARKPTPARKPAAKKPAPRPTAAKPPVTPVEDVPEVEEIDEVAASEPVVEPEVETEPEVEVEVEPEPEAVVEPSSAPEVHETSEPTADAAPARFSLPKFTLPKLTLPTLSSLKSSAVGTAVVLAEKPASVVVKTPSRAPARKPRGKAQTILSVTNLSKHFDENLAVDSINLTVAAGAFYGIVGPNGAGKTTTLSMITGLLRPDAGTILVHGADVWADPVVAKRNMGVLPDRLRLFDRLTGAQMLYYAGILRGMEASVVKSRTADLAGAFGLEDALGRLVSDYSAGMTKKIALAAAMIHSPRLLVLDEPFESVDPVSASTVTDILKKYVSAGGTVLLSSHSMDLVQRICDNVAVVVGGEILADGTMASVRGKGTLEERFAQLAGGRKSVEGLEWLHSFSD